MLVKIFTQEMLDFILENYKGRTVDELAVMFDNEFKTKIRVQSLRRWLKDRRLSNGVNTRFGSEKFKEIRKSKFRKKHVKTNTIYQEQRHAEEYIKSLNKETNLCD